MENHSRMLFRHLTFNWNFVNDFAVWRKNLNAIQDFVTESFQMCLHYFPPQKVLTLFRCVVYFDENKQPRNHAKFYIHENKQWPYLLYNLSHMKKFCWWRHEQNYNVITFFLKEIALQRPRVATFADIIKFVIICVKTIFKDPRN